NLAASTLEPVHFIHSHGVREAHRINKELEDLKLKKLFRIERPSNSRVERFNIELDRTLSRSTTLTFDTLRLRLLYRHSGLTVTPRQYAGQAKLSEPKVLALEPPVTCPGCQSSQIKVDL